MKKMKQEMEATPKARGASKPMVSDKNEESSTTFSKKHFGHVAKVAGALHGSDPFKHVK